MSSSAMTQKELIRKNVSAMTDHQEKTQQERSSLGRVSDAITKFSGSMLFVLLHVVWFGFWILLNVGLVHVPRISEFDPFPFGLLTMIVSLEAIFLSTFVLISQNRMSKLSEQRAELDLHINLLAEQKATKALELLDQMTQQLNTLKRFNFEPDPELEMLKRSPEPHEVLDAMRETIEDKVSEKVEEAVEEITGEIEVVQKEVREVTGETEAVREEVAAMDKKVEVVARDMHDIKGEIKEQTEEHAALSAK